jgi:polyhydroxybutyrate depolymerase
MAASFRRSGTVIALAALLASWPLALPACERNEPTPAPTPLRPGPGCGGAAQTGGKFVSQQLSVDARTRTYHMRLPDGYQPGRPYPLVFRFHGYSGDGLSGGLAIERVAARDAIVVGPDGLNSNWTQASEADDLRFFDALYESVSRRYCVDLARVYAYGFSAGGGFTNLLSCRRADKLRAIAVIAGFDRGRERCGGPVAAWYQHDHTDPKVPYGDGERARDRMRTRNRCAARKRAEGDCVHYEGCSAAVVWCATRGNGSGHEIDGERAPERVWAFLRSL